MNFGEIEKKWQVRWEKAKLFEANADKKRKKYFVTFPYPYVNGAPHIGHSYSFFRTEAMARFKRMQGFNVLFPQGYHATGEPILGVVERLIKDDPVQIKTFKLYGATDDEIENFKKDPKYVALFWSKRWTKDFKKAGASIDWRRTFITTTITPTYSKFIEWQYNTLKKNGFVTKGTHPVIWCPHCQSPTGDHDRLEGEGESPIEYTLIKFKIKDKVIPAGTLRPETSFGVTNMWVNAESDYVEADIDNEIWIVSESASLKLADQLKKVKIIRKFRGSELVGKKALNPVTKSEIEILPAKFVDSESVTGIVMSVPSHAPYDYIALKDLGKEIGAIKLIDTPNYKEFPAKEECERLGIKSQNDIKLLEEATRNVYKKEFHQGILNKNCGKYAGLKVSEAKEKITEDFIGQKIAESMWETTDKVVCRCTTKNYVKILENQWFLKFSDQNWKNKVKKYLQKTKCYPEEIRQQFLNTIDWLKDKACARKAGLGTPVPWDNEWIIETLSDSVIYMAYYTISKTINENKIKAESLTNEVFDYIFLDKGNLKEAVKSSGLKEEIVKEMKLEFDYWYPLDLRNSGKDLLQNHLTFMLFHHAAMWPQEKFPRAVGVNGYIKVEGEKMSKSKGNIIPFVNMVEEYSADLARFNVSTSSEGIDDADWRSENIKNIRARLEAIAELIRNLKKAKRTKTKFIDDYLISKIQLIIEKSTEHFEKMELRSASNYSFYELFNDINWYLKRCNGVDNANKKVLREALETFVKMAAPFTPHYSEEMWEQLGEKSFISTSSWPAGRKKLINNKAISAESMIKSVINDATNIIEMLGKKPSTIYLFVSHEWKYKAFKIIEKQESKHDVKLLIKALTSESELKKYGSELVKIAQSISKNQGRLPETILTQDDEFRALNDSAEFIGKSLDCRIKVIKAESSNEQKAKSAMPGKPGILIS